MSEKINTPELREKSADRMVRFLDFARDIAPLEGKKIGEVFGEEDTRREFIEHLSDRDFIELLSGINGILRDKEKTDWSVDGGPVMLSGFIEESIPPRQEDKEPLLKETLDGVKIMNKSGRTLEDIALLLGSSINAVHPFADGNGRTGRLVYALMRDGYNEETKPEIKKLLGEYGRDITDVYSAMTMFHISNLIKSEAGADDPELNPHHITNLFYHLPKLKISFQPEIPSDMKDKMIFSIQHDHEDMFLAMFKYIQNNPEIYKYIKEFPKRSALMLEQLIPDLNTQEIEKIFDMYWKIKQDRVRLFIDCIVEPDKPEYQLQTEGNREHISFLNELKTEITQKQKIIADH